MLSPYEIHNSGDAIVLQEVADHERYDSSAVENVVNQVHNDAVVVQRLHFAKSPWHVARVDTIVGSARRVALSHLAFFNLSTNLSEHHSWFKL